MTHHANLKIFIPILIMAGLLSCEKPEQPEGSLESLTLVEGRITRFSQESALYVPPMGGQ